MLPLIAFGTVFPVNLNLYSGIRGVDLRLVEAARSVGLTRRELIAEVILPGSLPSFLVLLRYALSVSVLILVVARRSTPRADAPEYAQALKSKLLRLLGVTSSERQLPTGTGASSFAATGAPPP